MLREHGKLLTRVHQCLDMGLVATSFILAYFIKRHFLPEGLTGLSNDPNYYVVLLLCIVFFYLSFNIFDFYYPYRKQTFDRILMKLIKGVAAGFSLVVLSLYLIKVSEFSRLMMAIFLLLTVLLLAVSKYVIYHVLAHYRRQGFNFRKVLVVGSRERAKEMIQSIQQAPESGYQLWGCLEIDDCFVGVEVMPGVKVIGTLADFHGLLLNQTVDEIVFAMPLRMIPEVRRYIAFAEEVGINIRILPDWQLQKVMYHPETASVYFEEFLGVPAIGLSSTPRKNTDLLIKAGIDYICAAAGMVVLSPLYILIAILIKLTSRGPVLFKQERCGENGRRFTLYKFRTMIDRAEEMRDALLVANEMNGPVFKMKEDPRVTKVGRVLRKTSLDELPQLFNVLKGEMSLVGPRPPLPAEVEKYEAWQRRRLSMKPGLTCIWQVGGRNEVDFEQWMKMDLEYIDKWSLMLDLKLLLFTIKAVVIGTGK